MNSRCLMTGAWPKVAKRQVRERNVGDRVDGELDAAPAVTGQERDAPPVAVGRVRSRDQARA